MAVHLLDHLTDWGLATEPVALEHHQADGYWHGPICAPSTALIGTDCGCLGSSSSPTRSMPGSEPCASYPASPTTLTPVPALAFVIRPTPGRRRFTCCSLWVACGAIRWIAGRPDRLLLQRREAQVTRPQAPWA